MAPPISIVSALGKGKNAMRGEVLDLDAATDPTDWEATPDFSFLRTLDNSLRCSLCYDIFTAPVVFRECHHTFCSACVRSHINQPEDKGKFCPQCRQTKATDNELVPVLGLEEAADAWRQARPTLMKAAESMRDLRSGTQRALNGNDGRDEDDGSSSSDEVEIVAGSSAAVSSSTSPRGVKRKLTDTQADTAGKDEGGRRTRQSTAAARSSSTANAGKQAPKSPVESSGGSSFKVTELKATDLTKCPICDQEFTLAKLNAHLDRGCQGSSEQSPSRTQSSWFVRPNGESSSFRNGGPPPFEGAKRLTRRQYHGIPKDVLKRLLEESGLPTTGSKDRQVARHREWVNIFNGNLDSAPAKRKNLAQLKKILKDFDRAQDAQERIRAQGGPVPKDKAGRWAEDHKAEFADLIAQARSSHEKNKEKFKSMPASQGTGSQQQQQQEQSTASEEDDDDDDIVEYIPDKRPPAEPREEAELAAGDFFT